MAENEFWIVIKLTAAHIPEMAILFLGIIIAFAKSGKNPRPALTSILGFGLLLGLNIAFFPFLIWFENKGREWGWQNENETCATIAFAIKSFLAAGAYGLLIWAIYSGRKPRAPMADSLEEH